LFFFSHTENLAPAHMLARRENTPTASAAQPAEGRLSPRPVAPQPRIRDWASGGASRWDANELRWLLQSCNPSHLASLWIN